MALSTTDTVLDLHRIAKSFGTRTVLDIEHLQIAAGEVHALLGQNGSGKSTLIKILSGYHHPDPDAGTRITVSGMAMASGSQHGARAAGLRFVHQDLGLIATMSVLDNIHLTGSYPTRALTLNSREARAGARAALARVGMTSLDPDTLIGSLSPAERTGVAIARALRPDGDIAPNALILDEPTATLPAPEIDRLLSILGDVAQTGVGILYVTHHLDEVFRVAGRVTVLRDGRVVASGPTADFTRDQIVHHLVGSELEAIHGPGPVVDDPTSPGRASGALVVEGLVAERVNGVSFSVAPQEVVGFHGVTGSGRESILSAVFGARARTAGSVHVGGEVVRAERPDDAIRCGMGFVPSDRKVVGCHLELTATENLTLPTLNSFWRRGRLQRTEETAEADAWFERMDVRPVDGAQFPMATFSGGNQQKIVLAKWLRQNPAVLLLDEPTQGVDIGAKAVIHRTILGAVSDGLAVVIASSDDEEIAALCSTVHIVQHGRIVDTLVGSEITAAALSRRLNASIDRHTATTLGAPS